MNYETYHIPVNYTDAGRLFGLFEMRNAIETAILVIPVLFLCAFFLPLGLTAKIITTLVIGVPLGGFSLIGIRDDSLTRFLSAWWRWHKRRRVLTYRGEIKA
ncbi:MAG: hypothetical protein RR450_06810 [Oscillospiraceae bacterium]